MERFVRSLGARRVYRARSHVRHSLFAEQTIVIAKITQRTIVIRRISIIGSDFARRNPRRFVGKLTANRAARQIRSGGNFAKIAINDNFRLFRLDFPCSYVSSYFDSNVRSLSVLTSLLCLSLPPLMLEFLPLAVT